MGGKSICQEGRTVLCGNSILTIIAERNEVWQSFSELKNRLDKDIHTIYDCVNSFFPLLDTEYHLILGRKGVAVELGIRFGKKDCHGQKIRLLRCSRDW